MGRVYAADYYAITPLRSFRRRSYRLVKSLTSIPPPVHSASYRTGGISFYLSAARQPARGPASKGRRFEEN